MMPVQMKMPMKNEFPYCSGRMPVLAQNVVATSQPLAAQAGLRMLLAGGNAVDAALAAAIALTVVEPTSNGIGSDLFAIVWDGQSLHGLNASGRSPAAWTRQRFANCQTMPVVGWETVTVPGAVSGWSALSLRFGKLPFEQLCKPAIHYAREGFLVSPITASAWQRSLMMFDEFADWKATFCPGGRPPFAGERFVSPAHAQTLEKIAATGGKAFYTGELAEQICRASQSAGAALCAEDLALHQPEWVETLSTRYRGTHLHEIPPNGQGVAALAALAILECLPLGDHPVDSPQSIHLQIEVMKLALADVYAQVADPAFMRVRPADICDPGYAKARSALIDPTRAGEYRTGLPREGGTVYLTAADASGMMVSLIQSNYFGFGSGIVIPGTGIAMQNRGYGFVLEKDHPNQVGPRKRPFHTIIPGFVMRDDKPLMSFGVMGGPMQAQGHVQMMTRIFDYEQNPQAASDAPRWQVMGGLKVIVEKGPAPATVEALRALGHDVRIAPSREFGGAQIIFRLDDGYLAATDHRKDGQAVGY
jgi:gamma-glutamyltranspeptidase/glutathione hydrolase